MEEESPFLEDSQTSIGELKDQPRTYEYDAPKFKDFSHPKYKTKRKILESIIHKNANALDKSLLLNYDSFDSEFEDVEWFSADHINHFPNDSFADHYLELDELEGTTDAMGYPNTVTKQLKLIDFVINNAKVGNRVKRLNEEDDEPKLQASELYAYLQQLDSSNALNTGEWSFTGTSPSEVDSPKESSAQKSSIFEKLSNSPLAKGNKRKLYEEIQPRKLAELSLSNGTTRHSSVGTSLLKTDASNHAIASKNSKPAAILTDIHSSIKPISSNLKVAKLPNFKTPPNVINVEKIILPTVVLLNDKENTENLKPNAQPRERSDSAPPKALGPTVFPNGKIEMAQFLKKMSKSEGKKTGMDDVKWLLAQHNAKVRPNRRS